MACGGCGSVEPYELYLQFSALAYEHINKGLTPEKYILLSWYEFRDYCLNAGWNKDKTVKMHENGAIEILPS